MGGCGGSTLLYPSSGKGVYVGSSGSYRSLVCRLSHSLLNSVKFVPSFVENINGCLFFGMGVHFYEPKVSGISDGGVVLTAWLNPLPVTADSRAPGTPGKKS